MAIADYRLEGLRDYRLPALVILILVSLSLEVIVHWYLGISIAYTHFFYVPVVLAAIWYGKRSIIVALLLGIAQLAGTYYSLGTVDIASLVRALMFILLAIVIGEIADRMKRDQEQIINEVTDAALRAGVKGKGKEGTSAEQKGRILSFASVRKLAERRDVPGLVRALQNKDPAVQYEAVEALGRIGDPAATDALMDALTGDQYSGIRWKAAEALGKIGPPAVPSLMEALKNTDEDIRWKAAVTLGEIGDERAIGPLVTLLGDDDRFVRSRAAYALGLIGSQAVPSLKTALLDKRPEVRRGAVLSLGMIHDSGAIAALIEDLDDPSDEVRQDLIAALSSQEEAAFDPLVGALGSSIPRKVEGVALALAGMNKPEVVPVLATVIERSDPASRPILQTILNDLVARQAQGMHTDEDIPPLS